MDVYTVFKAVTGDGADGNAAGDVAEPWHCPVVQMPPFSISDNQAKAT